MLDKLCAADEINDFSVISTLIQHIRKTLPLAADVLNADAENFDYAERLTYIRQIRAKKLDA